MYGTTTERAIAIIGNPRLSKRSRIAPASIVTESDSIRRSNRLRSFETRCQNTSVCPGLNHEQKFGIMYVPYWSVITPLTLISAFLHRKSASFRIDNYKPPRTPQSPTP